MSEEYRESAFQALRAKLFRDDDVEKSKGIGIVTDSNGVRGQTTLDVLQFLWEKPYDNLALAWLRTLRPFALRVSLDGCVTLASCPERVTVILKPGTNTIFKIYQEVSVGYGCGFDIRAITADRGYVTSGLSYDFSGTEADSDPDLEGTRNKLLLTDDAEKCLPKNRAELACEGIHLPPNLGGGRYGGTKLPILHFLWGQCLDNLALAWLPTARPSSLRVWDTEGRMPEGWMWRVTVVLKPGTKTIDRIYQEVEVGYSSGAVIRKITHDRGYGACPGAYS